MVNSFLMHHRDTLSRHGGEGEQSDTVMIVIGGINEEDHHQLAVAFAVFFFQKVGTFECGMVSPIIDTVRQTSRGKHQKKSPECDAHTHTGEEEEKITWTVNGEEVRA